MVEDDDGKTCRAVYTVKFAGVVYVLHAFQKKSKSGIKTPLEEIEKVKSRLRGGVPRVLKRLVLQGFREDGTFGPARRKSFVGCDLTAPEISALRHFSITLGHHRLREAEKDYAEWTEQQKRKDQDDH